MLIRSILESDPELQVVGEAVNGAEAVRLCAALAPDILTMDIQMPVMDGFEAIRRIMNTSPRPIVVVTSIDSSELVQVSFKALELGAITVMAKPRGLIGQDPEAKNLIAQVKAMAEVKVVRRVYQAPVAESLLPSPKWNIETRQLPRAVAVGVSTGGPPALQTLFAGLNQEFPVPILVVQHISKGFIEGLVSWLNETTPLHCKLAEHGETLQSGTVYFAPDNVHLTVRSPSLVWLDEKDGRQGHIPSVNMLFESAARVFGGSTVGILLTGMGSDGAKGLLALRQKGAVTIAQDESSSVIFGMPKAAIDMGAAEYVLPVGLIAPQLWGLMGGQKA
jgi:two-component system chemotaxis response regulator CheB